MSWRINSHAVQRPARDNDGVLDRRATHVVLSTLWMRLTDGMTLLASAAISMIVAIAALIRHARHDRRRSHGFGARRIL
jgi:hypothetical protein